MNNNLPCWLLPVHVFIAEKLIKIGYEYVGLTEDFRAPDSAEHIIGDCFLVFFDDEGFSIDINGALFSFQIQKQTPNSIKQWWREWESTNSHSGQMTLFD